MPDAQQLHIAHKLNPISNENKLIKLNQAGIQLQSSKSIGQTRRQYKKQPELNVDVSAEWLLEPTLHGHRVCVPARETLAHCTALHWLAKHCMRWVMSFHFYRDEM